MEGMMAVELGNMSGRTIVGAIGLVLAVGSRRIRGWMLCV